MESPSFLTFVDSIFLSVKAFKSRPKLYHRCTKSEQEIYCSDLVQRWYKVGAEKVLRMADRHLETGSKNTALSIMGDFSVNLAVEIINREFISN